MPVMLERWNDDKMDALDAKVNTLDVKFDALDAKVNALDVKFDALDAKVNALDVKFNALDAKVNGLDVRVARVEGDLRELRRDINAGFERVDERFERLHRLMVQFCGVALAALIGLIATQV